MKSSKTSTPKLGKLIDLLYEQDQKIKLQEKVLRDLKSKRFKIESQLLGQFEKKDLSGAAGKVGKSTLKEFRHLSIKGKNKFWRYVVKNKAFDLVQNRIASRAYFDRLEDGDEVPGVSVFTRYRINVRKR